MTAGPRAGDHGFDPARYVTPPERLTRLGRSEEFGFQQVLATGIAVAAASVFLLCAALAGAHLSVWWYPMGALAGLVVVAFGDTLYPMLVWAALGFFWVTQVPGPFSWWALGAALSGLVAHTVAAMAAARPTTLPWPSALLRLTARRVAVVAGVTAAVAGVAAVSVGARLSPSPFLLGSALVVVTVWAWAAWRTMAAGHDRSG